MPSTPDFNAQARAQREAVEATMPELQRAYARGIRKLGRRADANFVRYAAAPAVVVAAGQADWPMPDLDELFTIDWGAEVLEAETRAARAKMTAAATGVWAYDVDPAVRNRITGEVEQLLGQRITEVTAHVRDHAGVMLRQGLDEGWGVRKTATHLAGSFPDFSKSRGMLIARTEMIGAANASSLAMAKATGGATHKTWHARMDSRTRATHAAANGQTVRLEEPFAVDGVQMQYPGAEGAPAAEVCNCRCIIVYEDDRGDEAPAPAATEEEMAGAVDAFGGDVTGVEDDEMARHLTATAGDDLRRSGVNLEAAPVDVEWSDMLGQGRYHQAWNGAPARVEMGGHYFRNWKASKPLAAKAIDAQARTAFHHEYGHHLDFQGLASRAGAGSGSSMEKAARLVEMEDAMHARLAERGVTMTREEGLRTLGWTPEETAAADLWRTVQSTETTQAYNRGEKLDGRRYDGSEAEYLARPDETFARLMQRHVAEHSDDAELRAAVNVPPYAWTPADWSVIRPVLEAYLRSRGWTL